MGSPEAATAKTVGGMAGNLYLWKEEEAAGVGVEKANGHTGPAKFRPHDGSFGLSAVC